MALILMLVVAPLSGVVYQLFDRTVHLTGWYHVNYYYLLFFLSPHITLLIVLTGVFFLFPAQSKRAFFLIGPAGYHIAKIIWMVSISSNEEFYRPVPSSLVVIGALLAALYLITFDWLMSLHFHKREGSIARIIGIISAPGIEPVDAVGIARNEIKILKSIQ